MDDFRREIRERVRDRIGASRFRLWFEDSTTFELDGDALHVVTPNNFVGKWIAANYIDDLIAALRDLVGDSCRPEVRIQARPPGNGAPSAQREPPKPPPDPAAQRTRQRPIELRGRLENFVVGPSNEVAYTAAVAMIRTLGRACKLLVIHGGPGFGKTHLIQAICNGIRESDATIECRYISGEQFTNEFIASLNSGNMEAFRARFRDVDLLVVDDIHFLAGKKNTQDEFLHTFNAIDACGRSVVLTSDRHPRMLAALPEPLVDRLSAGLVVEIDPPDLETRRAIVARRAREMRHPLPDEVLDFVAVNVTRNVRELEGALHTLGALAGLMKDRVTLDVARTALRVVLAQNNRPPDPLTIARIVAAYFGVTVEQLHSRSRDRTVSLARAVAMHFVRRHTPLSFPEIGRAMGNKNHSTVVMAVQRVEELTGKNETVRWKDGIVAKQEPIETLLKELESRIAPPKPAFA